LALTIPKEPTELDDGLLTASEAAQLKLNADWVVLSACNRLVKRLADLGYAVELAPLPN